MQIIVVFGLPGAGKSFVGNALQEYFNYHHYDADVDMPADLLQAVNTQDLVTDSMRDRFFQAIIDKTKQLQKKQQKIVISQTFIKEKYRGLFLREFPETKFILVQTASKIRESRLRQRKNFPLDLEYAKKMCLIFDQPRIPYCIVNNDSDGEESIQKQLNFLPVI